MAKSLLKAEFDEASMIKKLKKLAKNYGNTQDQAIKRWGVQASRELAKFSVPVARGSKQSGDKISASSSAKVAMWKDASNVIIEHKGAAKKSRGGSFIVNINGKNRYIKQSDYLADVASATRWINQHRTRSNKRTVKLPLYDRKYCSTKVLGQTILAKYRMYSGMVKDGWLDAGEKISKGPKGKGRVSISASYIKWSRKPEKYGTAKQKKGLVNSFGELISKVSHSKSKYVLDTSSKKLAIQVGLENTIKWYRKTIKAENKKKK